MTPIVVVDPRSPGPPPEYTPTVNTSSGSQQVPVSLLTTSAQSSPTTVTTTISNITTSTATSNHGHNFHRHRHRRDYPSTRFSTWRQCQPSMTSVVTSSQQQHHYHHHRLFHHHHHHHSNSRPNSSNSTMMNEKSPFLIIKILLFSLMTIDFVMNTIGLAVIIVIVKNHYNNFIVERSFIIRSEFLASQSQNHQPFNGVGDLPHHIVADSATSQSEWSLLLPLLPSFIFAEILTLIGMFGVFCDLFSFTMTYAILKLITSLCYPSMASVAAVAAMAAATGTATTTTGVGPISTSNPFTTTPLPPFNLNDTAISIILPFDNEKINNTTLMMPVIEEVGSKPANIFYNHPYTPLDGSNKSSDSISGILMTTLSPLPQSSILPSMMASHNTTDLSTNRTTPVAVEVPTSPPSSSTLESSEEDEEFDSTPLSSPNIESAKLVTASPMMLNKQHSSIYKNSGWLKNYELNKDFRQMKKTDRLAKLKAREKQLRSRLLKLESLEALNKQHQQQNNSFLASYPFSNRFRTLSKSGRQWVFDLPHPSLSSSNREYGNSQQQQQQIMSSVLLPLDSQSHNIKYHHRVWDALLVTFEVIFAVAFAFNLLSNKRELENNHSLNDQDDFLDHSMDLDDEESSTGGHHRGRRRRGGAGGHHRGHHHHHHRHGQQYLWPYSPLATSIDAFYFAYFRLPPPPPSYFCHRSNSGSTQHRNQQQQQIQSNSQSDSGRRLRHHLTRTLFEGSNLRRFTPSWLFDRRSITVSDCRTSQRLPSNSRMIVDSPSPPQYEDIGRDHPINVIVIPGSHPNDMQVTISTEEQQQQQQQTSSTVQQQQSTERIDVLQTINETNFDTAGNSNSIEGENQDLRTDGSLNEISLTEILPTIIEMVVDEHEGNENTEKIENADHPPSSESNDDYNEANKNNNNNNVNVATTTTVRIIDTQV